MTTVAATAKKARRPSDELTPEALTEMLRLMQLIRRFEERCAQSYQQAKIGGFCHLYIGQEATAVGSICALQPDDPIITAYRDHGHALARGMDPRYCMAEMFGKVTGCAKGKGGSMHMFDAPHHMYGGHAIVGGQGPLGVGLAFEAQYTGKPRVTVCYFGDGALNQGAIHEAMNLAAIWRLPILFVVENNAYSMGTAIDRGTSNAHDLSVKAKAYGMRYAECDGLDALDTYDCFKRESDLARGSTSKSLGAEAEQGHGPCFINVKTYRFLGHSMSDPQKYRSKEEVQQKREHADPVLRLTHHLLEKKVLTQEQVEAMDAKAKQIASDSVKYANESPDTPMEELFTDVYSQPYGSYKVGEPSVMLREHDESAKA